mgnify:FL=1
MKNIVIPIFVGILFGIGLTISGMTNPSKVIGFLNIFGKWDPSLIFVMGGAILISLPTFLILQKKISYPFFNKEDGFQKISFKNIDSSLLIGSGLFGIGWGMVGFCPGPSIASLSMLNANALIFFASMSLGMLIKKLLN